MELLFNLPIFVLGATYEACKCPVQFLHSTAALKNVARPEVSPEEQALAVLEATALSNDLGVS
jgi:hypothetical protein